MSMKKSIAFFIQVMVLGFLVATFVASQTNNIVCYQVISSFYPCLPFEESHSPKPSDDCCSQANNAFQANTTQDRRDLCNCFQQAFAKFGAPFAKIRKLPSLCNIKPSIPLDPKADCSS